MTIVHWQDSSCSCTKYSYSHIEDLKRDLPNFEHIVVSKDNWQMAAAEIKQLFDFVPASPSVMVFDQMGELAYFGPYSGGAVCGSGEDYVEKTANLLDQGQNPHWVNQESIGCLCQWQNKAKTSLAQI